jgi:phenylalanyl-tRNA synthetase beta chain
LPKDVCAYLNHHDKKDLRPKLPTSNGFKIENRSLPVSVSVKMKKHVSDTVALVLPVLS